MNQYTPLHKPIPCFLYLTASDIADHAVFPHSHSVVEFRETSTIKWEACCCCLSMALPLLKPACSCIKRWLVALKIKTPLPVFSCTRITPVRWGHCVKHAPACVLFLAYSWDSSLIGSFYKWVRWQSRFLCRISLLCFVYTWWPVKTSLFLKYFNNNNSNNIIIIVVVVNYYWIL